jgi:hypothetical protein
MHVRKKIVFHFLLNSIGSHEYLAFFSLQILTFMLYAGLCAQQINDNR